MDAAFVCVCYGDERSNTQCIPPPSLRSPFQEIRAALALPEKRIMRPDRGASKRAWLTGGPIPVGSFPFYGKPM